MTEAPGPKAPGGPPGKPGRRIQSVLFVCNFNAVRSAAAEALARHYFGRSVYVQSAGVRSGGKHAHAASKGLSSERHSKATKAAMALEMSVKWIGLPCATCG